MIKRENFALKPPHFTNDTVNQTLICLTVSICVLKINFLHRASVRGGKDVGTGSVSLSAFLLQGD